jgi:[ribosomal protein S5]-alanine N-acetyltransferase
MANYCELHLSTARLDLRPLAVGDEDGLFAIHSDLEFMRYWSSPPWTTVEQAIKLIERDNREMLDGQHIRLGIFYRAENHLIGTCSLFNIDEQCRRAELGYGIARDFWRKGFMTEAVSAVIEYGFAVMGLNRLEADIDPRNTALCKSLEKLGFVREGYLRERWIVAGEVCDSALYGLLARDWHDSVRKCPTP